MTFINHEWKMVMFSTLDHARCILTYPCEMNGFDFRNIGLMQLSLEEYRQQDI